jgi:hypothetical protein
VSDEWIKTAGIFSSTVLSALAGVAVASLWLLKAITDSGKNGVKK